MYSSARRSLALRVAGVAAGAAALVVAGSAGPAAAAHNDSFTVETTNGGCGAVDFVDHGPGAAGGGDNDDYLVIHDYCADGHGVRAEAWLFWYRGNLQPGQLGLRYNGNGLAGDPVIWDPFREHGNVSARDVVMVEVCLVDGPNDPTPFRCDIDSITSVDG
jgi:hypothetical protein